MQEYEILKLSSVPFVCKQFPIKMPSGRYLNGIDLGEVSAYQDPYSHLTHL